MRNMNIKVILSKILCFLCISSSVVIPGQFNAFAYNKTEDCRVIVSLGDSYSAGEGLHDYYGEDKPLNERKTDEDFLSHRSKKAWAGMLYTNTSRTKTMVECKDTNWFFAAMSGAITNNIIGGNDPIPSNVEGTEYLYKNYMTIDYFKVGKFLVGASNGIGFFDLYNFFTIYEENEDVMINLQTTIFDDARLAGKEIDYVTMTMGGNDVEFSEIVKTLLHPTSLFPNAIHNKIKKIRDTFDDVQNNLRQVYSTVKTKAGEHADLIVAGYPHLLEPSGKGALIHKDEAYAVNSAIDEFNKMIADTAGEFNYVHYVPVDFSGHEVYSDDPWLYNYEWLAKSDDITRMASFFISAASFHPNEKGAAEYARVVNDKLDELDAIKNTQDDEFVPDDILGTYKGSYFANQGETGLTLTVYRDGEKTKALFDFYNLPGKTNAESGKYYMDVSYEPDIDIYTFTATEWISKPPSYNLLDLKGSLTGEVLSGDSPTKFSIIRTDDITSDKDTPEDVFIFNGHSYKIFSDVCNTWEEAKLYCENLGGHLAVVSSQEENDALYNYVVQKGIKTAYFGYTDSATDGDWVWVSNEPNTFINWAQGEPNSERGENYAEFYWKYEDGTWNDGNFGTGTQSDSKNFICEWDSVTDIGSRPLTNFDAYKETLASHPEYTSNTYGDTEYYNYTEYTLYDINKNGSPELIVKEDSWRYYVYSLDDGSCKMCSDTYFLWTYSDCLYEHPDEGMIVWDGGMGNMHAEYLAWYMLLNNGELVWYDDTLTTELGATYQEIQDARAELTPIDDFYPITDYTLLNKY